MEHIRVSMEIKQKTEKLLRRVDVRPKPFESVYSQGYMSRQRVIRDRIKKASEKISQQTKNNDKYQRVLEKEDYRNAVIKKKLGLEPKPSIEKQLEQLGIKIPDQSQLKEDEDRMNDDDIADAYGMTNTQSLLKKTISPAQRI